MSKFYSQKSYPNVNLGTCKDSIKTSGCAITTCCNLFPRIIDFDMTPPELNDFCKKNGVYVSGCALVMPTLSSKLGMEYKKTTNKPDVVCMAETDHWKSYGVPQHFFMLKPDNSIIDPLDTNPDWKKNPYNVVSYRVYNAPAKPKKELKIEPEIEEPIKPTPEPPKPPTEPPVAQKVPSTDPFDKYEPEPKKPAPEEIKVDLWRELAEKIMLFILNLINKIK